LVCELVRDFQNFLYRDLLRLQLALVVVGSLEVLNESLFFRDFIQDAYLLLFDLALLWVFPDGGHALGGLLQVTELSNDSLLAVLWGAIGW
jgi:hypothetical protein